MVISAQLRALTRCSQLSTSIFSYQSVFRNVNTPWVVFSKPDLNDLAAQNETKRLSVSNPTSIVFKPKEDTKCFKIRRIVETPDGVALFELSKEGDVYYPVNKVFLHILKGYVRVAELYIPSFFNHNICSSLTEAAIVGMNIQGVIADEKTDEKIEDSVPSEINSCSKNNTISDVVCDLVSKFIWAMIRSSDKMVIDSGTGCIKLTLNLDDLFEIRTWEIETNGDKTVLEIIVGELQRHGFDFTEDPLALQKLEQAVERAIARRSNVVKLNLPVPAGHPEMSTTVSWGTSDYGYRSCSPSDDCVTPCPQ
ncbi:hypothetical protein MKW94_017823 [Papaver nudicaule]|uniref:Uncharacterized protein n=1 Tax=Papaver nudicaule TaxID=74823 RepID=A0AA42ATE7_PAPNU|nr:hypothetical protein [Papaver nudicaule]